MKTVAVLLVAITACAATQNHIDVTNRLSWYRAGHGGGLIPSDDQLVFDAFEATNTICEKGLGHHSGTKAEFAALDIVSHDPCPDGSNGKDTLQGTLKTFYGECPAYRGAERIAQNSGHFTHIVWQASTKYGMWSQTCDRVPSTSSFPGGCTNCCVSAYLSDGLANLPNAFGRNIDNPGQCVDVEQPWLGVTG